MITATVRQESTLVMMMDELDAYGRGFRIERNTNEWREIRYPSYLVPRSIHTLVLVVYPHHSDPYTDTVEISPEGHYFSHRVYENQFRFASFGVR